MELQQHFEEVRRLIRQGQAKALRAVYAEQLSVYWQVGAYVHQRLQTSEWGDKIVNQLATWLKGKEPSLKGFDKRSLYRMKDFYAIWHRLDWDALRKDGSIQLEAEYSQQNDSQTSTFVVSVTPQFKEINNILSSLSWTHHVEILGKTNNIEEKVFYTLLSVKEKYTVRELRRQIDAGLYERQKLSSARLINNSHPNAAIIPQIFRDKYIFEFLDLPEPYSENDLQKALVKRLKQFLLEIGRDFSFIGEEYRIQVGSQDFFLDLLFYQRELQCLVVFELLCCTQHNSSYVV